MPVLQVSHVDNLPEHLEFLSDSQDVQAVKHQIGGRTLEFDSFFADVRDGFYAEVWGMRGIVPHIARSVTRIL